MALAIPQDEALKQLEEAVSSLGQADAQLRGCQAEHDAKAKKLSDQYAPKIDRLTAKRDELMDAIYEIVTQHREFLIDSQPGKTLTLRGGTIRLRWAQDALEVTDEGMAFKSLRRLGKYRLFTKRGKVTIDKVGLKKHPDIIAKMKGVVLRRTENLLVTPAKTQLEIKKATHPLRRSLGS